MNKHKLTKWIKLLPVIALLIAGIWLYRFAYGYGFLGLILLGTACIISCYYLLAAWRHRAANALKKALTCLLIVGIVLYLLTLVPIFRAAGGTSSAGCDYIVVLGAKVNGTVPSPTLKSRIDAAFDYLTKNPTAIAVLSGGQGSDEGISEAQCMFNELTKMGISPDRLWIEDKATSTRENLDFSLALIETKTGSRPARFGIVSSEFHLYRARRVAKDCGIIAALIPAETNKLFLKLNYYLREVAAVWYYISLGG